MSSSTVEIIGSPERPDAVGYVPTDLSIDRQKELMTAVRAHAFVRPLPLSVNPISREDDQVGKLLATVVARGADIADDIDWLEEYYREEFPEVVSKWMGQVAIPLENISEGIMGNVIGYMMRFETHVDQWPLNANLYLQGDSPIIIGHPDARTHQDVREARTRIESSPGTMSIVSALRLPHSVEVNWKNPKLLRDIPPAMLREDFYEQRYAIYNNYVFREPDITSDDFWETARISVNFGYSTSEFNALLASGQAVQDSVSDFIYGGVE